MFSGIGPWQLLIVLVIVIAIFGTKKLRNVGTDLGGAVKGFKDAMGEGEKEQDQKQINQQNADSDNQTETSTEHKDKV